MMNLFKFELGRLLRSGMVWGLVNGLLIFMFMLMFPSMEEAGMQALVEAELGAMPEGLLEAFGIDMGVNFANITDFLAYVIQWIAMASGVYGAILGVNSLVREESEGTIELLYSQPIDRRSIVLGKIASNVAIYAIYLAIVWAFTLASCMWVRPENVAFADILSDVSIIVLGMAIIGYVFMAIGFLLSTLVKTSKKAVPMAIALFFLTFLMGVFGKLKDEVSFFKYLSPFEYGAPSDIVNNGVKTSSWILALLIVAVCLLLTGYIYKRKDMRI